MNVVTIKMTKTQDGSPDGIIVNTYSAGGVYDIPESLAKSFIDMGCCERHNRIETPESSKKRIYKSKQ